MRVLNKIKMFECRACKDILPTKHNLSVGSCSSTCPKVVSVGNIFLNTLGWEIIDQSEEHDLDLFVLTAWMIWDDRKLPE